MTTPTPYPPLPQPPEPVMPEAKPGRSCPGCRSADSWGMPDCPGQGAGCFPTADGTGSRFTPLNAAAPKEGGRG